MHGGIDSCFFVCGVYATIELHVIEGIPQLIFVRSSYTIEVCSLLRALSPSNLLQFWLLSFSHIFLLLLFKDSRSWANFCRSCCTFETIWWRLCCYSTWVIPFLYHFTIWEERKYYALIWFWYVYNEGNMILNAVAAHLAGIHSAIKMLNSRIRILHSYLLAMQNGNSIIYYA